ncbi:MAG: DUF4842 domain-containing protein [Bacteroidales bacterium]
MKKTFLLIAVAIFGVSCINEDFESMKLDLDNLSPFTEELAPIQEGKTTIIKADGVVICETNIEMGYSFPKGAVKTIEYLPIKKDVIYGGWDVNAFTAAFEDTRNGDNDYNDFVCYITREKKKNGNNVQLDIYIQPIAYGAGTNLQFGIRLPNGIDTIISTNIRSDFFPNTVGFVNTVNPDTTLYQTGDANHIKKITYTQVGKQNDFLRIHPFIINEAGEKLFVALSGNIKNDYLSIVSVTGYPLGIAISGGFNYVKEKTNISTVYQDFNSWVTGNSTSIGNSNNSQGAKANLFKISDIINNNPKNLFNK